MIEYNLGERSCKLDFNTFINLTFNNDTKMYKNDFKDLANLYEVIDKNKNSITNILLDGHEYFLEKGFLHNLYGPAYIIYNNESIFVASGSKSLFFYIDGKLVSNTNNNDRGCRDLDDFKNDVIFFFEKLTIPHTGRRQEGIDYIKHYINLEQRIKLDQRKKKLKIISEYE